MSDVMDDEDDDDDALHNVLRNVNEGGVMPGETEYARLSAVAGDERFKRTKKDASQSKSKSSPVAQEGPRQGTVADLLDDEDSFEHSIFLELNEDSDIPGDATMLEAEARLGALPVSRARPPKPSPVALDNGNAEPKSKSMSDVMDDEDDDDDALHNVLRNVNEGGVMPGETEYARLSAVAGDQRFKREPKKETAKSEPKPTPVAQEGPRQATVADLLEDEDSFEHSIFLELNEDSDIPGDATMVEAEARLGALPISRPRTPKPSPGALDGDDEDTVSELDDEEESYEHSIFADLGDDSDIPGDERMNEAEARLGAGVYAKKTQK
eukprot:CAMPEP_0196657906 /NCGR_PEP_ID=MMETSP1086-20130531/26391_1 /TAXON_ID=77921 /ORGANISM="Cyanoptyche  gloeocystis , Strain SAG4.97" /LENGTH=324 /DNA_ID=CAMNT_0041991229 /DNA_START=308 /DNA_END=1282 /DNA_ORIENTATION=+